MPYKLNTPCQLENKRKESQDKLYKRQPQLMNRLDKFIEKSNAIQNSEPSLQSPKQPLSENINVEPINKISSLSVNKNIRYKKIKKISEINPKITFGLK